MGIKRYALSEEQWLRVASLVPGKVADRGRTGADNRLFVNGCLRVLRSGAHFRRFATRYDRRIIHFTGFVHLAAAMIWLR